MLKTRIMFSLESFSILFLWFLQEKQNGLEVQALLWDLIAGE